MLDGIPATALFDTGASHSFMRKEWVEAHHLPTTPMPIYILVRFFTGRQDPIESLLCVRQVHLIGAPIS